MVDFLRPIGEAKILLRLESSASTALLLELSSGPPAACDDPSAGQKDWLPSWEEGGGGGGDSARVRTDRDRPADVSGGDTGRVCATGNDKTDSQ